MKRYNILFIFSIVLFIFASHAHPASAEIGNGKCEINFKCVLGFYYCDEIGGAIKETYCDDTGECASADCKGNTACARCGKCTDEQLRGLSWFVPWTTLYGDVYAMHRKDANFCCKGGSQFSAETCGS